MARIMSSRLYGVNGGDFVQRINTTIRKDDTATANQVRSELGWAHFINACLGLWVSDVKFKNSIRRFKDVNRINQSK